MTCDDLGNNMLLKDVMDLPRRKLFLYSEVVLPPSQDNTTILWVMLYT